MESTLPVVERFHSIQGEGVHSGRSAYFIRLASCKVGCPWCDTKNSWTTDNYPQINVIELSKQAIDACIKGAAFIVLTGGEPLHHDLNPLCKAIRTKAKEKNLLKLPIHIETSGVNAITGKPDWITLSPKPHAPPTKEILSACQELKIVVNKKDDLIFAEEMAKTALNKEKECQTYKHMITEKLPILFLQPGWNNPQGQVLACEYVKNNPTWRLSLQTHKWLNIL